MSFKSWNKLSEDEKKEIKESGKEAVKERFKEIKEAQERLLKSGEGLDIYSQKWVGMHQYSINNRILIMMQCPCAEHVRSFNKWKEDGMMVQKGSKAIKILAPIFKKWDKENEDEKSKKSEKTEEKTEQLMVVGFKEVPVFDVSQIVDGDAKKKLIIENKMIKSEVSDDLCKKVMAEIMAADKRVELGGDMFAPSFGSATIATDVEKVSIRVSSMIGNKEQLHTYFHEAAHSILHGIESKETREVKELQAEFTSFLVGKAFGMDFTEHSALYMKGWGDGIADCGKFLGECEFAAKQIIEFMKKNTSLPCLIK